MSGGCEGGFHPTRLIYWVKKGRKSNGKYAVTGIRDYYAFSPIRGRVTKPNLSPGSSKVPFYTLATAQDSTFHAPEYSAPTIRLVRLPQSVIILQKLSHSEAKPPTNIVSNAETSSKAVKVLRVSNPKASPIRQSHSEEHVHVARASTSKAYTTSTFHPSEHTSSGCRESTHTDAPKRGSSRVVSAKAPHAEEVDPLAHLANCQSDRWFYLRIGAHRHDDDVDHEAENHAVEEEAHLLAHEIAAELHPHLQHLHRDFSLWWAGWHGHEAEAADAAEEHVQEVARALEETVDGVDHEKHSWIGGLGTHVAENFWGWGDEQRLTIATIHSLDDLPHVLHAEHFHNPFVLLEHGEAYEIDGTESSIDCDGWRHGFHFQADGWWMYRTSHSLTEYEPDTPLPTTPADWKAIQLDISAYELPMNMPKPSMAGHEAPPAE